MTFRLTKTLVLSAIFSLAFSSSTLHAQARPSPATQVISVDFVPLAIGYPMAFQYEIKADPTSSWMARLSFWPGIAGQWTGFGVGGAYRFYIADSRALTGLAAAPAADLFFFNQSALSGGEGSRSAIAVDFGGDLSYKWIFDQFAIEPILGLRFGIGASAPGAVATIFPIIGCSLGYAW